MGGSYENLVSGTLTYIDKSDVWTLYMIAGHLINRTQGGAIALKLLTKAEQLTNISTSASDRHFLYLSFIQLYQRQKNSDQVRRYSKQMVDISEQVSNEFKRVYGKNKISHQGYIERLHRIN